MIEYKMHKKIQCVSLQPLLIAIMSVFSEVLVNYSRSATIAITVISNWDLISKIAWEKQKLICTHCLDMDLNEALLLTMVSYLKRKYQKRYEKNIIWAFIHFDSNTMHGLKSSILYWSGLWFTLSVSFSSHKTIFSSR